MMFFVRAKCRKEILKGVLLGSGLLLGTFSFGIVGASEGNPDADTQKSATQQVGGLLFDVDEGVKVEQGPGGSVYMKSNREYMQDKFREIENRLGALEKRVATLELEKQSSAEDSSLLGANATDSEPSSRKNRVLAS